MVYGISIDVTSVPRSVSFGSFDPSQVVGSMPNFGKKAFEDAQGFHHSHIAWPATPSCPSSPKVTCEPTSFFNPAELKRLVALRHFWSNAQ